MFMHVFMSPDFSLTWGVLSRCRSLILLRSSFRWKHLSYNPSYLEDAVKTCLHSRWTLCSLLIHKVKAEKSQLSVNSSIVSDSVKIRDTGLQKPVFSAGIFLVMFFRELNPKMTFTSLHHVQLFWQSVRSLHEKSTTVMKKIYILLQLWIIFLTIEQRKKLFLHDIFIATYLLFLSEKLHTFAFHPLVPSSHFPFAFLVSLALRNMKLIEEIIFGCVFLISLKREIVY